MNTQLKTLFVYVGSAIIVSTLTTAVSFAWSTNTRLTRLETALISLSENVRDIKTLLQEAHRNAR